VGQTFKLLSFALTRNIRLAYISSVSDKEIDMVVNAIKLFLHQKY